MSLTHKRIVITAGPTREAIDPVRFISNRSSGKMAYAIANACLAAGATVTVISGPTCLTLPKAIHRIDVTSALDMHQAVLNQACDIFIAAAAVSDYRASTTTKQKIKKDQQTLTLNLVKNPDILFDVSTQNPRPFCVGFAAETQNLERYALQKLQQKNLDMLVANLVADNQVFDKDDNTATVFFRDHSQQALPTMSKKILAKKLVAMIDDHYQQSIIATQQC